MDRYQFNIARAEMIELDVSGLSAKEVGEKMELYSKLFECKAFAYLAGRWDTIDPKGIPTYDKFTIEPFVEKITDKYVWATDGKGWKWRYFPTIDPGSRSIIKIKPHTF